MPLTNEQLERIFKTVTGTQKRQGFRAMVKPAQILEMITEIYTWRRIGADIQQAMKEAPSGGTPQVGKPAQAKKAV